MTLVCAAATVYWTQRRRDAENLKETPRLGDEQSALPLRSPSLKEDVPTTAQNHPSFFLRASASRRGRIRLPLCLCASASKNHPLLSPNLEVFEIRGDASLRILRAIVAPRGYVLKRSSIST